MSDNPTTPEHDQDPARFGDGKAVQIDLREHYGEAIKYLDDNYAYFLTHVLNIGRPEWNTSIGTAAVAVVSANEKELKSAKQIQEAFKFLFNPKFAETLPTEDMAFILAHETMHVVLNHLKLFTGFVNMKKDTPQEIEYKRSILNIAADCVINDYLVNFGMQAPEGLCQGEPIVGYNCANATVTEVYRDLKKECDKQVQQMQCNTCGGSGEVPDQQGSGQSDEGDEGDQEGDGSGGDEGEKDSDQHSQSDGDGKEDSNSQAHAPGGTKPCPDCQGSGMQPGQGGQGGGIPIPYPGKQIDDHTWIHEADKKQQDAAEGATGKANPLPQNLQDTKDDDDRKARYQGSGVSGIEAFTKREGVGFKWAELLQKINPFVFDRGPKPRPAWHRRPRKLMANQFRDTILPVHDQGTKFEGGNKPAIVMALDTSGSIPQSDRNLFVNLAKSIPQKHIKLFVCTFTSEYMPLDLEDPHWASGGTDFSAIQRFIENDVKPENRGKYPTSVVVVTDGYANFMAGDTPQDKEADAWTWLLTVQDPGYMSEYPGDTYQLKDYATGV